MNYNVGEQGREVKVSVQEGEKGAESGFIGYLSMWSAYWTYLEKYPHLPVDPLDELQSRWVRLRREGISTGGRKERRGGGDKGSGGLIGYLRIWSTYWTYHEKHSLLILLMNYNQGKVGERRYQYRREKGKERRGAKSGFIVSLRTWSAYWTYLEKHPHLPVDPLEELQSRWAR